MIATWTPAPIQYRSGHAILIPAMKLILGLAVLIFIALSVFADYKWKQWIAARKQDHDR